ncbi:LytR/AlgR family response regulator transcription factor [Deminuibacter soli]|uniref:DNA-binding response regulator n=1 Tax=Deminuibacter soli TaxID=2291815 RepID=A0A3E1NKG8_9BACT|nr:response regulator transcription factor [Deminuibacter soli]RFM28278.1 DNA-binding response regulator [Deminuibacter soli]
MQKYNCMIVEDEPLAAEILTDYIKQVPFLQLTHTCSDAIYAMELLQTQPVDLIFLDIHLPKVKGFDFIKTLQHPPHIIITSAYQEYALQGYELNVTDYLLKPIAFSRFLMAVNKLAPPPAQHPPAAERPWLFFMTGKKKVKVWADEILYVESLKEYSRIFTIGKSLLTKCPLHEMEALLAKFHFIRVHRSFIVARDKIEAFTATEIDIAGKQIPIGRSYKELIVSMLEQNG